MVTERGEVYLLGLVSEAEGQEAAQLASETSGVLKVVTLYEYLDQVRAKRAHKTPPGVVCDLAALCLYCLRSPFATRAASLGLVVALPSCFHGCAGFCSVARGASNCA